jgi:lysine 2,3-aminomutase
MHLINKYKKNLSIEKTTKLLKKLLDENPDLEGILLDSSSAKESLFRIREWIEPVLKKSKIGYNFYKSQTHNWEEFEELPWRDMACIRILDYLDNEGRIFEDLNLRGKSVITQPFTQLWKEVHHEGTACSQDYYEDLIFLFRQFRGELPLNKPDKKTITKWMDRWPDGMDERIQHHRYKNKNRIIEVFINKVEAGQIKDPRYHFKEGLSRAEKRAQVNKWWNNAKFHLKFAIRNPDDLNEYLGYTLDEKTMSTLFRAREKGMPFFINLYYLSLINVNQSAYAEGADQVLRDYVFYSNALIEEYGQIVAWEKEDEVEPGKPNAAGWLLPGSHNIHRRYPEVSILIPDTVGRACGGLCVSCQRMYDFQRGNLNFNLEKLRPKEKWDQKLPELLKYWEKDSQLRDILITGGDALMSSNESLQKILKAVLQMAKNKVEANKNRPNGEKYAEILRVRLGTRLPVYLPQRITSDLIKILRDFKTEAMAIGMKQFFIQTHFESPLEVTPEAASGIEKLIAAGWTVTNQMVFTAAASRRGHSAKLRKVLNDLGVINYYTFTVKGYSENSFNYATIERAMQEQLEEKILGRIPSRYAEEIASFSENAENIVERIDDLRKHLNVPYLGTDRNVLNLPGVGKSLTFRTIGITRYGRRVLEFDYDKIREHSPLTRELGKVIIIESKSIRDYLNQIRDYGEDPAEYRSIWGYSIGVTEKKNPMYDYPDYAYQVTSQYTHLGSGE